MASLTKVSISDQSLVIQTPTREVTIDLAHALCPRMYTRPETRAYSCESSFTVSRVYPLGEGFRVVLRNETEGLLIPVVVKPEDGGFRLIIEAGKIVEQYGINRKLMELDVLPDLLTSKVGDNGFFLMPCFSGALVRFRERTPMVNRDRIYMDQEHWEKLNMFNAYAMKRGDSGVLAIVNQGDFFCYVTTEVNQQGTNRIYASLGLRHNPAETIKAEDKEIIFRFLEGDEAEYPGMAMAFRDYLVAERGVSPLKPRLADNPVLAYSVGAMRVKVFHGVKQQPFAADGRSPVDIHTTCEEAGLILDAMKAAGIHKAIITLVGWNLGGHDGAYPTRFPVEPGIGGEDALRELIRKALDMGYQIVPHDNWTDVYRGAPDYDADAVAKDEHGLLHIHGLWGGGQGLKSCPIAMMERYGHDFDRVRALGFSGHYYMDAQSTVLWTCHDPRHPADEQAFMTALAALTQVPRALYGAISCEFAPVHHLPYLDEVASVPTEVGAYSHMNSASDGLRDLIDEIVPFWPIAIHGLLRYGMGHVHCYRDRPGGAKKWLLYELAHGATPCMEVEYRPGGFGDVYTDSIADVRDAYRTAFEELPDIYVEMIEEFVSLAPEANRVTYSGGCTVSVNWGETPVGDLPPLSYRVERS